MPVITVDYNNFCKLLGKPVPIEEIEERLPMLGIGWEGKESDNFSVEIFPNRPDMLSVEGLARAFASFMNIEKGLRKYKADNSEYLVIVEPQTARVRSVFVSCIIKDVAMSESFLKSIIQMQEKLHVTHGRKRRKVAIGLHDLDKIAFPVTYTTEGPEFKFVPLDETKEWSMKEILEKHPKGSDYSWILHNMLEYPLLVDGKGNVLSMPPIINGNHTKITEETRNIFVDITATDEKAAREVLNIIATTFADRGAVVQKTKIRDPKKGIVYTPDLSPAMMNLDPKYVNKTLGLKLTNFEIIEYLQRMGYDAIEIGNDNIEVLVPCYRTDVMHTFDLVEDIAIAYGYENFEAFIPNVSTIGEENPLESFATKLRSLMVGYGLQECLTFMLTNKENLFAKMNVPEVSIAETDNSKTNEYNVVRNWLLPSLMEVLERNKHNEYPQNVFEVGDVVLLDNETESGGRTSKRLAVTLCHSKTNFSEIKALVESVLRNLGVEGLKLEEGDHTSFIPGRSGRLDYEFMPVVNFGEVHPLVLQKWKIEMPVVACEFDVELIFELLKNKN